MSEPGSPIFLLEIGCEEIPDWMIVPALEFLQREFRSLCEKERLGAPLFEPPFLGTPRRLCLMARGLRIRQEDREVEVAGPRVEAAYDASGAPTRALEGFARSQGMTPDRVLRIPTPKGECVAVRRKEAGRNATEVLAGALPGILEAIPFRKTMRWGEGSFRFARPIHWILCLFGTEIVPFQVAGISSGRGTRGARFEGSPELEVPAAEEYLSLLGLSSVVVDLEERKRHIASLLSDSCAGMGKGLQVEEHADLLDAVTGMVEFPVASPGSFDRGFLDLPAAVLSTAMIHHQRFFPVRSSDGSLAPHYVAVLNCRADRRVIENIRRGNEWVLRARLRDADFFWKEDLKHSLESRLPGLEKVLFEATLGSYRKKVERVEALARTLCGDLESRGRALDSAGVAEAARLCKADLTTLMVKEFPELQGIMGGLYARKEGKRETICRALGEQYVGTGEAGSRRRFETAEGAVLVVADRLDTLAGFFLLDRAPTGSRDPYGLRRAATALVQATLDQGLDYSLEPLLEQAGRLYAEEKIPSSTEGLRRISPFLEERLRHVCLEVHSFRYDAVKAALAVGARNLLDAFRRIEALNGIRGHSDFEALSLSYRRVRNILAGQEAPPLDEAGLSTQEERALLESLRGAEDSSAPLLSAGDYGASLRVMAGLRLPLDRFFDTVLVMDPDLRARGNRLALLKRISLLFLRVGDFAEMVLEGENAAEPAKGVKRG